MHAGRCPCGYSPTHRVFNFLQDTALTELRSTHDLGQGAALVVLPPGSGKTRIAAEDAKAVGAKQVLYVAHTHEILDVAHSEFAAVFGAGNVRRHSKPHDLRRLGKIQLANLSSCSCTIRRRFPVGASITSSLTSFTMLPPCRIDTCWIVCLARSRFSRV